MNILKDSSFYPVLKEWAAEARERHGEIKALRKVLIRLGRIRFGRLDKASRAGSRRSTTRSGSNP